MSWSVAKFFADRCVRGVAMSNGAVRGSYTRDHTGLPQLAGVTRARGWIAKSMQPVVRVIGSLWSRLSLAMQFAIVAAVIVAISMAILGTWVASRVKDGVIKHAAIESAFYMHNFIEPHAQDLGRSAALPSESVEKIDELLKSSSLGRKVKVIKLWAKNGYLAYSSEPSQIGKLFPETPRLKSAWSGKVEAQLESMEDHEHEHERNLGVRLMEIYAPIYALGTNQIIGVMEIYEVATDLVSDIAYAQKQSWLAVSSLSLLMMLLLSAVVNSGSKKIEHQEAMLVTQIDELGRLLADNRALQTSLAEAHNRSAHHSERFLRRVGSDLHDGPAQLIGFALLRLDSAMPPREEANALDEPQSQPAVESIRSALQDALTEIRTLSAGLTLPDLERGSVREVVELAVRNHERRTGNVVDLKAHGNDSQSCSVPIKECIYRFIQEALNNSSRHAPEAHRLVELWQSDTELQVEISDTGNGFDPVVAMQKQDSLGLVGLRDRVQSLGGRFEIESDVGKGTRLSAFLSKTGCGVSDK